MRALPILALMVAFGQIATSADAALVISSDQVVHAADEARKACARAAQVAGVTVMIDPTTLANLERVKALCDIAAGRPLGRKDWPERIDSQAREVADLENLARGMEALFVCRDLALLRAKAGRASATPEEITAIAVLTKPRGGMAVLDMTALVGFVEARNLCAQAAEMEGQGQVGGER